MKCNRCESEIEKDKEKRLVIDGGDPTLPAYDMSRNENGSPVYLLCQPCTDICLAINRKLSKQIEDAFEKEYGWRRSS